MSELFASLEKVQRYDLPGAATAADVGAEDTRSYPKGSYELHAQGPVVVKVAAKGSELTRSDLTVDPSSRPWKFKLERTAPVQLAAATTDGVKAWIVPLVEG